MILLPESRALSRETRLPVLCGGLPLGKKPQGWNFGPGQQIANACWEAQPTSALIALPIERSAGRCRSVKTRPIPCVRSLVSTRPFLLLISLSDLLLPYATGSGPGCVGVVTALFRADSQVFSLPVLELSFLSSECSSPIIIIIIIINALIGSPWSSKVQKSSSKSAWPLLMLVMGCLLSAPICIALFVICKGLYSTLTFMKKKTGSVFSCLLLAGFLSVAGMGFRTFHSRLCC